GDVGRRVGRDRVVVDERCCLPRFATIEKLLRDRSCTIRATDLALDVRRRVRRRRVPGDVTPRRVMRAKLVGVLRCGDEVGFERLEAATVIQAKALFFAWITRAFDGLIERFADNGGRSKEAAEREEERLVSVG